MKLYKILYEEKIQRSFEEPDIRYYDTRSKELEAQNDSDAIDRFALIMKGVKAEYVRNVRIYQIGRQVLDRQPWSE